MPLVTVKNLTKVYSNELMLDKISFEVEKGELCALIGPENSGKTPLLEILANLKFADSGEVEAPLSQTRFIPDGVLALERMTANDLFLQTLHMYHVTDRTECDQLCELFEVDRSKKLLDMTYMENKCVAIINALMTAPDLLLIDEPYHDMTEDGYEKLLTLLQNKCKEGMTVIMSCTTYSSVQGYAQRYVYLHEGDLIQTGVIPENFRPWRMVTVFDCELDQLMEDGDKPVVTKGRRKCYLYKDTSTKLLSILEKSGCSDFLIEELTLEEQLFYNYERWN